MGFSRTRGHVTTKHDNSDHAGAAARGGAEIPNQRAARTFTARSAGLSRQGADLPPLRRPSGKTRQQPAQQSPSRAGESKLYPFFVRLAKTTFLGAPQGFSHRLTCAVR